jgi:polysaccharide export outer membrane protein
MTTATPHRTPCSDRHPARLRWSRSLAVALAAFAAVSAGCAGVHPVPPPREARFGDFEIGASDELKVTILPEPVTQEAVVVRPDGMISISLVGDVPAAGRRVSEIAAEIETRISRFKREAKVDVALVKANSTAITVLGEVRGPSSFPLVKETRVSEALGRVGGLTTFANDDEIRVIRSGGGEAQVFIVDMAAIMRGDQTTNIALASGDIVYAPPSVWAQIGYAVQAVLFPFQPLIGLGTSTAGAFIAP